jgi:hypothetical protein
MCDSCVRAITERRSENPAEPARERLSSPREPPPRRHPARRARPGLVALRRSRLGAGRAGPARPRRPRGLEARAASARGRRARGRSGPGVRLPRRDQAGQRASGAAGRGRGALLPRHRCFDGWLHRLPSEGWRQGGGGGRRRLRAAGLAPAPGPAGGGDGARQRPEPHPGRASLAPRADHGRRLLHLPGEAARPDRIGRRR